MRSFPRQVAEQTGAAVVMIDHVTKDSESRGRFAIGGQAKLAGLTGAAYTVDVAHPLGTGCAGSSSCASPRIGQARCAGTAAPCAVTGRRSGPRRRRLHRQHHRGHRRAVAGRQRSRRRASAPPHGRHGEGVRDRESTPGLTKNKIADAAGSGRAVVLQAVDILVEEGFFTRVSGPNRSDCTPCRRPTAPPSIRPTRSPTVSEPPSSPKRWCVVPVPTPGTGEPPTQWFGDHLGTTENHQGERPTSPALLLVSTASVVDVVEASSGSAQ